ncbi:MAG: VOC family protein, partial [Myxococcota bacterium]
MAEHKNLGIIGYDSIRFVSLDLERSREFYVDKMDFAVTGRTTPGFEQEFGYKGLVFSARNITVEVVESLDDLSAPAKHLRQHSAGISAVRFLVKDIEFARDTLASRGATFMNDGVLTTEADGGTYRFFEIASPLGNTTYGFVQRDNFSRFAPGFDTIDGEGGTNKFDFAGIDHLTSNMRTLKPYIDWFKNV